MYQSIQGIDIITQSLKKFVYVVIGGNIAFSNIY